MTDISSFGNSAMEKFNRFFKAYKKKLIYCLLGCLMSICGIYNIYPFASALLCATDVYLKWIFAGTVITSLFYGKQTLGMISVNLFILIAKLMWKRHARVTTTVKLLISMSAAVILATQYCLFEKPTFNQAIFAISVSALLPIFTVLYSFIYRKKSVYEKAAWMAFLFTGILLLTRVKFGLFEPAAAVSYFAVLAAAKKYGFVTGGAVGFICGLACGYLYIPSLGVCGMTAGLLLGTNNYFALAASLIGAVAVGCHFGGVSMLLPCTVNFLLASMFFFVLSPYLPKKNILALNTAAPENKEYGEKRMLALASAFSSLSRIINELPAETNISEKASEYGSISKIIASAVHQTSEAETENKELTRELTNCLKNLKLVFCGVRVTGRREITVEITGIDLKTLACPTSQMIRIISELSGRYVGEPELIISGNLAKMIFRTVPVISVEYAAGSAAKNGENICGDTISSFKARSNRFYTVLSDGMGSGSEAALTSRLSVIFLEKLLSVGIDKTEALTMLNKTLIDKRGEVFATIDLLDIDCILSTATVTKAGAAPTVLIRNKKLHKIESSTPPAGIIKNVLAEETKIALRGGDLIVLMSDGIVFDGDKCLPEKFAENAKGKTVGRLCAEIIDSASEKTACGDDMSVCVIRVVERRM